MRHLDARVLFIFTRTWCPLQLVLAPLPKCDLLKLLLWRLVAAWTHVGGRGNFLQLAEFLESHEPKLARTSLPGMHCRFLSHLRGLLCLAFPLSRCLVSPGYDLTKHFLGHCFLYALALSLGQEISGHGLRTVAVNLRVADVAHVSRLLVDASVQLHAAARLVHVHFSGGRLLQGSLINGCRH